MSNSNDYCQIELIFQVYIIDDEKLLPVLVSIIFVIEISTWYNRTIVQRCNIIFTSFLSHGLFDFNVDFLNYFKNFYRCRGLRIRLVKFVTKKRFFKSSFNSIQVFVFENYINIVDKKVSTIYILLKFISVT